MGGMVDFGFLEHAGSLDPVSHTIERMGERMAAERARKQKMAEDVRNADRNFTLSKRRTQALTDREDRMERGQNAQMEVDNSKRRSDVDSKIYADIAAGDTASARRRAADYSEVNPSDQSVTHGRPFEMREPEAPGPEPSPPELKNELDPSGEEIPGAADANLEAQDSFPGQQAAYQARVSGAKLGPSVKLGDTETSVDEIRNGARRQSAADFSKFGDSLQMEMKQALESGDPLLREQATRRAERYSQLRAGVEAGTIKPFDAMKMLTSGQTLDDRYRDNARHDTTVGEYGLKRQRIANHKPSASPVASGAGGSMSALSQYAEDNPGDQPGLYRLAERLKVPDPGKVVGKIIQQSKLTEGQAKDAKQSAIATRAMDEIDKSGYTPSRDEIQTWLNNQKQVAIAQKAGEGGGISGLIGGAMAGAAQGIGMLPQNEQEGLSPEAQDYFANVRRYMETIGRAQSGAAISEGEWRNFFNQYGPGSKGGAAAARQYADEQSRVSGPGSRQIKSHGGAPAQGGAPSGETKEQRMARLRKILGR